MSAGNINENFVRNFCSARLSNDDVRFFNLFDMQECRVRTRDVLRDKANSVFRSTIPQSQEQETAESKFQGLWKLREKNWENLTELQKKNCDDNLQRISPELFNQKIREKSSSLEGARWACLESYSFSIGNIRGVGSERPLDSERLLERLKARLITHGRAGINVQGEVVKDDELDAMKKEGSVIEIQCRPDSSEPLFVRLPNGLEWDLHNGENTRLWNDIKKCNRPLIPGVENTFSYRHHNFFSIRFEKKPEASSRNTPKAQPSAERKSGPSTTRAEQKTSEESSVEKARRACLKENGISITSRDAEAITALLIADGKVGINAEGEIIRGDAVKQYDDSVEIVCNPGGKPSVFIRLPDHFEWNLKNSEDTRFHAHRGKGKVVRELRPGENQCFYDKKLIFAVDVSSKKAEKEAPSNQPKAEPSAPGKSGPSSGPSTARAEQKTRQESSVEQARRACLKENGISIGSRDAEAITTLLIADGKVGINAEGELIRGDSVKQYDDSVEIVCNPEVNPSVFIRLPDHFEWNLKNTEDTRFHAHRGRGKVVRELRPGENQCFYDKKLIFVVHVSSKKAEKEAPSNQPKAEPSAPNKPKPSPSESSSSQETKKSGPSRAAPSQAAPKSTANNSPSQDEILNFYRTGVSGVTMGDLRVMDRLKDPRVLETALPAEKRIPYVLLGLSPKASEEDIKDAHQKLRRRFHPDKNPGNNAAGEVFKILETAFVAIQRIREQEKS